MVDIFLAWRRKGGIGGWGCEWVNGGGNGVWVWVGDRGGGEVDVGRRQRVWWWWC